MTYAAQADVEARMDRPLLSSEVNRCDALLSDVAAALSARYTVTELGTLVSGHFALLVSAQARAVARLLATPVGPVQSSRLDDASVAFYPTETELLTASELAEINTALAQGTGSGGLISVQLTSSASPLETA